MREGRALTAVLFKNGIANNLWLVNRESCGVRRNTDNMQNVAEQLLEGQNPYESCAYITTDEVLARQICENNKFVYAAVNENYIIKPE